jgi:hypothetical protein
MIESETNIDNSENRDTIERQNFALSHHSFLTKIN